MGLQWFPTDAEKNRALFEHAYRLYQDTIVATNQTPASREVIREEVRRSPKHTPLTLLARKRAKLSP